MTKGHVCYSDIWEISTANLMVHNSTLWGTNHLSDVCVSSFSVKSVVKIESIFPEPYDGRSVLIAPCRLPVYPNFTFTMVSAVCEWFHALTFLGPISLLAFIYWRKSSP